MTKQFKYTLPCATDCAEAAAFTYTDLYADDVSNGTSKSAEGHALQKVNNVCIGRKKR